MIYSKILFFFILISKSGTYFFYGDEIKFCSINYHKLLFYDGQHLSSNGVKITTFISKGFMNNNLKTNAFPHLISSLKGSETEIIQF